ncbi:hypothetical protein LINPERPRIM_LOCUS16923, partial [Linum perenne]
LIPPEFRINPLTQFFISPKFILNSPTISKIHPYLHPPETPYLLYLQPNVLLIQEYFMRLIIY